MTQHTENEQPAILSLGSNCPHRRSMLTEALRRIEAEAGHITRISPCYSSPSWGFQSEHDFLNIACLIDTKLPPVELMKTLLNIEQRMGRLRKNDPILQPVSPSEKQTYSDRTIDIDIIYYNNLVCDTPLLQLPHPKATMRRFVLQPVADICPHWTHPLLRLSSVELLRQCPDPSRLHLEAPVSLAEDGKKENKL